MTRGPLEETMPRPTLIPLGLAALLLSAALPADDAAVPAASAAAPAAAAAPASPNPSPAPSPVQASPAASAAPAPAPAASSPLADETMLFFEQESKVVTASRRAQSVREAPANVK